MVSLSRPRCGLLSVWRFPLPVKVAMLALVTAISHAWRCDAHRISVGGPTVITDLIDVPADGDPSGVGRGEGERCQWDGETTVGAVA